METVWILLVRSEKTRVLWEPFAFTSEKDAINFFEKNKTYIKRSQALIDDLKEQCIGSTLGIEPVKENWYSTYTLVEKKIQTLS